MKDSTKTALFTLLKSVLTAVIVFVSALIGTNL